MKSAEELRKEAEDSIEQENENNFKEAIKLTIQRVIHAGNELEGRQKELAELMDMDMGDFLASSWHMENNSASSNHRRR